MRRGSWWVGPVLTALCTACGSSSAVPPLGTLQPLSAGDRWTYRTTDADGSDPEEKTTKVLREEEVDGQVAMLLETTRGTDVGRVWLVNDGDRIVRVREETTRAGVVTERRRFSPGSLRAPASLSGLRVGDELLAGYTEETLRADGSLVSSRELSLSWVVVALDETVTTPAGSFRAVHLRRIGTASDAKEVWYAAGVGKVQERGGRIELLTSFSVRGGQ